MKMVPIGELIEPVQKQDPRSAGGGLTFTYVDIGAVSQDTKQIEGPQEVDCAEAPSRARQVISEDDILVSTVRPNLNAVARVGAQFDGATASTGFSVLRPDQEKLSPSYLFHWVRTETFIKNMMLQATGQSYPAVSDKIVKASEIPLPPLEEQRRIAAILDQADALRRLRARALDKLNTLGQAIFHEMFGDPIGDNPRFPKRTLADYVPQDRPITYGILKPGPDVDGGVPYVRVVDMVIDEIAVGSVKRTSREIAASYERSKLRAGDLLMSIRGHVGRTSIVPEELDGANITQDTARLSVPKDAAEYFRYSILHSSSQDWMRRRTKGAAVKGINLGDLRELPVLDAPLHLRAEFCNKLDVLRSKLAAQRKSVLACDGLFTSLQHRAFRG